MMSEPCLQVEKLVKRYPENPPRPSFFKGGGKHVHSSDDVPTGQGNYPGFALQEISFTLPRGYIMGLIGPNGSGKSTTVKAIMNLVRPDGGSISVCGRDHREEEEAVRRLIGYVGEEQFFYGEKTVRWTADFVSRYYPDWDDSLYRRLLQKFSLDVRKRVKDLSRGMKVKLALVLAMAHRPRLLILDEPTSGLDPIVRHELLREMLGVIQDEECSILFSSHITGDIEKVADFITILNDGIVLESGPKDEIIHRYRRVTLPKETAREIARDRFVAWKEAAPGAVAVTADYPRLRERLGRDLPGETLTLDQILLSLVKGEV